MLEKCSLKVFFSKKGGFEHPPTFFYIIPNFVNISRLSLHFYWDIYTYNICASEVLHFSKFSNAKLHYTLYTKVSYLKVAQERAAFRNRTISTADLFGTWMSV